MRKSSILGCWRGVLIFGVAAALLGLAWPGFAQEPAKPAAGGGVGSGVGSGVGAGGQTLKLKTRQRVEMEKGSGRHVMTEKSVEWDPKQTALIICDMWDLHHCLNAVRRVGEVAPRMNELIKEARKRGVTIIHAPSDCTAFYNQTPARERARQVPKAANLPKDIGNWCTKIPSESQGKYPIDQSDGGEDDDPAEHAEWAKKLAGTGRNPRAPWKRQVDVLEIDQQTDYISDSGVEIWSLMEQKGLKNVMLMGVHTNMCVLGRPFGLRQMAQNGKNVVLIRDMTDTMYNPARWPYVSHFSGTDLIVEHIEKWVCPTITSRDLLGGAEFRFSGDKRPHVVMVIAEDEYKTDRTLPAFADQYLRAGFRVTNLIGSTQEKFDIPGLEHVAEADVLVVSARRRVVKEGDLALIKAHCQAGKPVIGVRTASHAFSSFAGAKVPKGHATWDEFDAKVLGGHYAGHYGGKGQSAEGTFSWRIKEAGDHPILSGIQEGEFVAKGWLYKNTPLAKGTTPLMMGRVDKNPPEPVAWTNEYMGGRVFYTSMGHPEDFENPQFNRMLFNAFHWAVKMAPGKFPEQAGPAGLQGWHNIAVPGAWEEVSNGKFAGYDGFAWYRCWVDVPKEWSGRKIGFWATKVDNCYEVYWNGKKVGGAGSLPPNYKPDVDAVKQTEIPADQIKFGEPNLLTIRVFDEGGRGGFKGAAPRLVAGAEAHDLSGTWQLRTGDDVAWSKEDREKPIKEMTYPAKGRAAGRADQIQATVASANDPGREAGVAVGATDDVKEMIRKFTPRGETINGSKPTEAKKAAGEFETKGGVKVELALSEPLVRQPLFMDFDERGRLWVVQYLQYPFPAGLKVVSYDEHLRAVFDKVPPPPPNHFRGADKITIHEDTDGDGVYDKHKVFVEGLNIATSCARGRGGVWVLNPPYLLFYPDRNDDDVPDGDPEVHLSGFGLEDTHAVANSLRWGPDGWLYGAHGSTCTATIQGQKFLGQAIWRYHPEKRKFELFAEGGGNSFSVEFDSKGRVYSGHNGGNTRGFHFIQGGYYLKGWGKHGPLTNPHAYGFFGDMAHNSSVERFSHNFIIYEGGTLGADQEGKLMGIVPLHNYVVTSRMTARGSTFSTRDEWKSMTTSDRWFRPVDIKAGPDGAVYIADWYDQRLTHVDPRDNWDRSNGRIYRLVPEKGGLRKPVDLGKLTSRELVALLRDSNKWTRQTANRLLADRRDRSVTGELTKMAEGETGQTALEALWALHGIGAMDSALAGRLLDHQDPHVRLWSARLACDEGQVMEDLAGQLARLAGTEGDIEVRNQLACSARRLPGRQALPIVAGLLRHDKDSQDPYQPLAIWWAVESKAISDRAAVVALAGQGGGASNTGSIMRETILPRLVQRYSAEGTPEFLSVATSLISAAPAADHVRLLKSMEAAFLGRKIDRIPQDLKDLLIRTGSKGREEEGLSLRLRAGIDGAHEQVLAYVKREEPAIAGKRLELIELLGQVGGPQAAPVLLDLAEKSKSNAIRRTALLAAQRFEDESIGERIVGMYAKLPTGENVRYTALDVLSKRRGWALALLKAVDAGKIPAAEVPLELVERIKLHKDPQAMQLIGRHWNAVALTSSQKQEQIDRYKAVLAGGKGNAAAGRQEFTLRCAICHKINGAGNTIGPDLTGYELDNTEMMLLSTVDPNAALREEYTNFTMRTRDGLLLTGYVLDRSPATVTIEDGVKGRVAVPRQNILSLDASPLSRMPEGLLGTMTDQQVRDLFEFLRSSRVKPQGQ